MPSRGTIIALMAITSIGLALRMTNVFESLWLDELHTGWVVKDGWDEVSWRARIGNQSPVWFYAVKVITTLVGESELTLRLLSLLAGTTLMPAVFWLVQLLSKSSVGGLLAAAIVAVDRHAIFYATEARPYACLQLAAALQLGLFWQILQEPSTRRRVAWIVLSGLAFQLHYTGILIVPGEFVVLLGYYGLSRKTVPYRPWRSLFDWQVVVMLCLPALAHVLEVGQRRGMWRSISDLPAWDQLLSLLSLTHVIFVALLAYSVWLIAKRWSDDRSPDCWTSLLVVAVWFAVPIFAAWLVARWDLAAVFSRRYLIAFGIGPALLSGLLVVHIPWRALQFIAAAGLIAYALYDSQIIEQLRYDGRAVGDRQEDWRSAIAWLRTKNRDRQATIILDAALVEDEHPINEDSPQWEAEVQYRSFALRSLYDPGSTKIMPASAYPSNGFWLKQGDHIPFWSIHRRRVDPELWSNVNDYAQFGNVTIIGVTPENPPTSPPSRAPSATP